MATLGSPGVSVSVIDQSFYTPSAPGTVPMFFVATAANKANASGTGTAAGTIDANAGKVWVMTSQRDLTETFGTPKFYTDSSNNPLHGYELNEYGLQAAYSVLGVSSRAYVVRADIDLSSLAPATTIPEGTPVAGTYWLDTSSSLFGINEWNSVTKTFKVITPLIVDDMNVLEESSTGTPSSNFGKIGNYAVYVTKDNCTNYSNAVFYKNSSNVWVKVSTASGNTWDDGTKKLVVGPHYQYPNFTTAPSGSIWIKTTTPGYGANVAVKYYSGSTQSWTTISAPIYSSTAQGIRALDPSGGGLNIPVGTLIVESDPDHYGIASSGANVTSEFRVWRRNSVGSTNITSVQTLSTTSNNSLFDIRETLADGSWGPRKTVTVLSWTDANPNTIAQNIPAALSAVTLTNIVATFDPIKNQVTISHTLGGSFEINDNTNNPLSILGFTAYDMSTQLGTANLYTSPVGDQFQFIATNWKPLVYQSQIDSPSTPPANGTLWYDVNLEDVDILYNNGTHWVGYQDATAFPSSNPTGPLLSATAPTIQSDGSALVNGDIWIDTSDLEKYGSMIYVWDSVSLSWILQDPTDQYSPNGWLFADARWSGAGNDSVPDTIQALLTYNYVDPDCPDPILYPAGTRLWNTRRSGFNVKQYQSGYININGVANERYLNEQMNGYFPDRWVTVSQNNVNGSGTFGRMAQRGVIVSSLKSLIDTNTAIRDTDTIVFNLIATPGYPEAIQNMIAFNTDVGQTAFVIGDTPFRLTPSATAITNWGNNSAVATDNGDAGGVSYDSYMSMFYPSGYTTDNSGHAIVVPPSHMMLRTIINSDNKSYPWFAPAGIRRGVIDNATSVGYVNEFGEFQTVSLYENLRSAMATVKINPIATMPGIGLVNYGQYTRESGSSSLDRMNVARLVAYLRRQLTILAKPFLFEPNDVQTRREIKGAADSLLLELMGQRALYDFITVCDSSNNTPSRIDRNELWLDIAIEPVKAVEFIYIPVRLLNTGAIASSNLGSKYHGSGQ